jgi:hypothetical protein
MDPSQNESRSDNGMRIEEFEIHEEKKEETVSINKHYGTAGKNNNS